MFSGSRGLERVAIFISGGGSTMQALLEFQHQLRVSVIVTNKKSILGILKAKRFGVPVIYLNKDLSFAQLSDKLKILKINKIILAGFMKLLPSQFVDVWKDKIYNIHPSLLPKYPGLHSAESSWKDKMDMGVTIHKVIAEVDAGKILLQQKSLSTVGSFGLKEAEIFLRRTEQFLLREMTIRYL